MKIKSKFQLALYIISIVLAVVAVFLVVSAIMYINSYYTSYGMSFADGWKDALQYIFQNGVVWLIYALLTFTGAKIIGKLEEIAPTPKKKKAPKAPKHAKQPEAVATEETSEAVTTEEAPASVEEIEEIPNTSNDK